MLDGQRCLVADIEKVANLVHEKTLGIAKIQYFAASYQGQAIGQNGAWRRIQKSNLMLTGVHSTKYHNEGQDPIVRLAGSSAETKAKSIDTIVFQSFQTQHPRCTKIVETHLIHDVGRESERSGAPRQLNKSEHSKSSRAKAEDVLAETRNAVETGQSSKIIDEQYDEQGKHDNPKVVMESGKVPVVVEGCVGSVIELPRTS